MYVATRMERQALRRRNKYERITKRVTRGTALTVIVLGLLLAAARFSPLVTVGHATQNYFSLQELRGVLPPGPDDPFDAFAAADAVGQAFNWIAAENFKSFLRSIMHDHWLRIGRCEQPGRGYGGVDWQGGGTNHVGLFEGGLGILAQAWDENRPPGIPDSALNATPFEQMLVATRIYNRFGAGAWSCK